MEKVHLQQKNRWGGKLYCNHADHDIGTFIGAYVDHFHKLLLRAQIHNMLLLYYYTTEITAPHANMSTIFG